METTRRWQVEKYKIGCISLNPVDRFSAVTAHLKREMRYAIFSVLASSTSADLPATRSIWDLRKIGRASCRERVS